MRHKHSNVVGPYGELETAQVATWARLHDINEIIDRDTWHIVRSAVRGCPQLDYNLAVHYTDVPLLSQYMYGEQSDAPFNVNGTFDHLKETQAFAGDGLRDFNEIIDDNNWKVARRLNKGSVRA